MMQSMSFIHTHFMELSDLRQVTKEVCTVTVNVLIDLNKADAHVSYPIPSLLLRRPT